MSSDSKETPDKFRKQSQTKPKKKKKIPQSLNTHKQRWKDSLILVLCSKAAGHIE